MRAIVCFFVHLDSVHMLVKFVLFYLEQLQRYDTLKNVQFLSTLYLQRGRCICEIMHGHRC